MKRAIYCLSILILFTMYAFGERQFAIYETSTGKKLSINELAEKTVSAKIIFFGEFHDDSIIHIIQKDYLEALYKLNPKLAVSLEMFERDAQPAIDNYLADKISEDSMLKVSRPWPDYKEFYRPLLELAKSKKAPVIAANIPRKYAALYASDGWTGILKLPQNERELIASSINISEDNYMKKFYETMHANFGLDSNAVLSPNQENTLYLYYGAQVIKDETMAESIMNYLHKNRDWHVIHFNGDFHSNNRLGTVQRVSARNKLLGIAVIAPAYVDKGKSPDFLSEHKDDGDFLIVLEEKEKEIFPPGSMGGHVSENNIVSHKIKIALDPVKHYLEGSDIIKFKNPIAKKSSVKILKDLKIDNVSSPNGQIDVQYKNDSLYQEIIISTKKAEISEIYLTYKGNIYHSPNELLLSQRHSNTPGIISDAKGEGIYLPGGSYFPQTEKDLADFDIEISLPKEITIITSGNLVSTRKEGNNKIYNYKSELPTDDMILVGGNYMEKDTIYDNKTFSLFTFAKSTAGEQYLNSSIQFYKYYTKLFGPYPYNSFKIVENFFASGFGMPGYTLLSNKLMALPWVVLAPGSLAHEFVHNWWGNSIYVDYNYGNWCEALTSFSANYYYNILTNNNEAALDWRKKALLSLESLPEKDKYPLVKFKGQTNNNDAVIGYQKGGLMFYELYKVFGDEKFFTVLKNFAQKYKGKRASWMSLQMMFSEQTKKDSSKIPVKKIFDQWLNKDSIPTLLLQNVKIAKDSVTFSIKQDLKYYMQIPVRVITEKDTICQNCTITNSNNYFAIKTNSKFKSITIDPDYQSLRRLNKWEIPYSFSLTLGDFPLLIIPSKDSKDYPVAVKFADMVKESDYKVDVKSIDDLQDEDWTNRSIIVVGDEKSNNFFAQMKAHYPDSINIKGNEIVIGKQKFTEEGSMLLLNCANPKNANKNASIIYCGNLDSPEQFRRLFHYLSYSMVLVSNSKMGRPLSQLEIFPTQTDKHELEYK